MWSSCSFISGFHISEDWKIGDTIGVQSAIIKEKNSDIYVTKFFTCFFDH